MPAASLAVKSISADYTVSLSDTALLVNAGSGGVTVTLPPVGTIGRGRFFIVKKVAGIGSVTVDASGSETIDGSLTSTISTLWSTLMLLSDGAQWFLV